MTILDAFLLSLVQSLPNTSLFVGQKILTGVADLFGGIILLAIGVLIIILIVAAAIVLLPAIIVAVVVWFLTGSFLYAGIAFLAVAVIAIVAMADD
ncbi:MAG: hypothetical protein OK456_10810 [Thaumarchaeota archaeon]|nr:hypothetical protein [Nitrososphaerota archaeon]